MNIGRHNNERLHEEQVEFIRRMLDLIKSQDRKTLEEEANKFYDLFFDAGAPRLGKDDIEKDKIEDYVKLFIHFGWTEGDLFFNVQDFYEAMKENLPAERWEVYKNFLETRQPLCFFREGDFTA